MVNISKLNIPKDKPISVLSVGTKILLKDVMDQYLRSLGDIKTYYAQKLSTAIESQISKKPNIIFCEYNFPEGGVLDFLKGIGGIDRSAHTYFVLAVEQNSDSLFALAQELAIDEILIKPFSTEDIRQIVERFIEKNNTLSGDWFLELKSARSAYLEKRFQESDELFTAISKKFLNNPLVLLECAEYFLSRGNAAVAALLGDKILTASPQNVRALHITGSALKKLGRHSEAVDRFSRANLLSPLNYMRGVELAETYLMMAEAEISNVLKSETENSGFILLKAKYQFLRKDYGSVLNYLDAKKAFLSESDRKDAEFLINASKKFAGIR